VEEATQSMLQFSIAKWLGEVNATEDSILNVLAEPEHLTIEQHEALEYVRGNLVEARDWLEGIQKKR
jgi:hypothetical protein